MKYFLDTEFEENGKDIMPISLALVAEDGRELYVEYDFDEARARRNDFVRENVLVHLRDGQRRLSRKEVAAEIVNFVAPYSQPQFWAYFADYDWVLMCQTFGTMMELPRGWPMWCNGS